VHFLLEALKDAMFWKGKRLILQISVRRNHGSEPESLFRVVFREKAIGHGSVEWIPI